ncbi:nitrilase-related carbon-nitrogen hydrolase [Microbacterium rhizosphaerae]|uniref:Nitrilase-related carbon-nitrogen hydrolase n=1 Tax=Microbacterium rhizosphaerae TaxID=1678237 RepID=A0ABZ0SLI1_9MICO|nr:nitrilase-related carbon-nitrogen hydrolase [Microbacterium rhizosphaerae]WPR89458.1 nitrilase-related carbon-nitrogen hydrolase [Microbacterium rhizosphaerae]
MQPAQAPRSLRVAAASPEVELGDVAGNGERISDALRAAVEEGARLIVLPELATSGYVFTDPSEARAAAVTRDDPMWAQISAVLPDGVVAVVGYAERDGSDLYNTAAVLTGIDRLGDYRKSHLWGSEGEFFLRGDIAGAVFDSPIGRLGVAICYDNEFPEVPRGLALAGAEVLALPVNWPLVARPAGEHAPETIQAMAAARSSRLATVIADRHGKERGVTWTSGTAVIDEDGWVAALPGLGNLAVAELILRAPGDKSLPPYNDLFADRRPELY